MEKVSSDRTNRCLICGPGSGEGAVQKRTTSTSSNLSNSGSFHLAEMSLWTDFIRVDLWGHISCTVDKGIKLLS